MRPLDGGAQAQARAAEGRDEALLDLSGPTGEVDEFARRICRLAPAAARGDDVAQRAVAILRFLLPLTSGSGALGAR